MKVVLQNLTKQFPGRGKGNPPVIAVNDFNYKYQILCLEENI